MWTNYHTHSNFCDGTESIAAIASAALGKGIQSLGVSSHAPLPFETPWSMKPNRLADYFLEMEKVKSLFHSIEIYKGLEVDYIPGRRKPADFADDLDYTIGSIHFVDEFQDGKGWEIDGTHKLFLTGLSQLFKNDIRGAVTRYFELTREMLTVSPPTIVGHLDKIKMQNAGESLFRESDHWYVAEIEKILDAVEVSGVIVEVNTRGVYQRKCDVVYPSPWILGKILERNIPVTLSSDAHHSKDLTSYFSEATQQLLAIGFRKISILSEGSWKPATLTTDGIKLP
jgi:histidinol-phosphatase (PHP family)